MSEYLFKMRVVDKGLREPEAITHALRGSWKIGIATGVFVVFGILADAYAQVIGPLTNEDPKEISSMSGTCTRHGDQLKCHFIEILVRQPRSAEDRKKAVEEDVAFLRRKEKVGKSYSENLCDTDFPQYEKNIRTKYAQPEQEELLKGALNLLRQEKKFCSDPSSERNMHEFAQWTVDQNDLTCRVELAGPWELDFAQQSEGLWTTQQGPQGPCGTVNVITLEKNKSSVLHWTYRTKRVITNPHGDKDLPESMRLCNKLREHTLTFSNTEPYPKWRNCARIEFGGYAPSP